MSAFKYQWNQTIDVGTAGLSKQWTSIRHILSLLVTANACVHVTAYVAVRRSLSTTYIAVVLGLLLRQYVSYQFGVWAVSVYRYVYMHTRDLIIQWRHLSVMASQIIDDLSLCLSGINQSPVDSPHKGVALQRFDVSPTKLPIKHKRDQTQERQVNWHTHFDGLV